MKRYRKNKQSKILVISSLCFLFIMVCGYAAFSTNLNITAKGNVVNYNAAWQLKKEIVTEGDGLYIDEYEDNRYIYRGVNPNNYIEFNGEIWRIIAIEPDDTLKIILNSKRLGTMQWDNASNRNNDNNTYCNRKYTYGGVTQYWGCNAWNRVNGIFINENYDGTVTQDASLNTYLNNDFYNSLNEDKKYIINHDFHTGIIIYSGNASTDTMTISEIYQTEKTKIWNGNIGVINISDYFKASTNNQCLNTSLSRNDNAPCSYENGNYLDEFKQETWTINAVSTIVYPTASVRSVSAHFVHATEGLIQGGISGSNALAKYLIRPVIFLDANIKLEGSGEKNVPFKIKKTI